MAGVDQMELPAWKVHRTVPAAGGVGVGLGGMVGIWVGAVVGVVGAGDAQALRVRQAKRNAARNKGENRLNIFTSVRIWRKYRWETGYME